MLIRRILFLLAIVSVPAIADFNTSYKKFSLIGSLFERVGKVKDIDPYLLYSIAIVESASGKGKGLIAPTPLVLRYGGEALFFDTKEEAAAKLTEILKTTSNVDVGLMQVNLKYHPQVKPFDLFDAEKNLLVASDILKKAMGSTSDPIIGIGRYHHWADESLSRWYGERVQTIYNNIIKH